LARQKNESYIKGCQHPRLYNSTNIPERFPFSFLSLRLFLHFFLADSKPNARASCISLFGSQFGRGGEERRGENLMHRISPLTLCVNKDRNLKEGV